MTGTDPAILAAQRAWESEGWGGPDRPLEEGMSEGSLAEAAAREALEPIRDLHKPMNLYLPCEASEIHPEAFETGVGEWCCPVCTDLDGGPQKVCVECQFDDGEHLEWPCDTARLIYTSEELNHD